MDNQVFTQVTDTEIISTRMFNATPEIVYKCWTQPEHFVKWWGPDGFSTTLKEMDVRVGGLWRFVMHSADGEDFPDKAVYEEIIPNEKLIYTHGWDLEGKENETFHVVVTFENLNNQTKLTMRMKFQNPIELERVKRFGAVKGNQQTLNRLANIVKEIST